MRHDNARSVAVNNNIAGSRSAPGEVYRVSSLHLVTTRSWGDLLWGCRWTGVMVAAGVGLGAGVGVGVELAVAVAVDVDVAVAVAVPVAIAVAVGVAVGVALLSLSAA